MSNNKIWVILGAFLTLFMSACTNELVLTDTWRDIPVVYGILSTQDTAHYIRLEKAFLDANKGALDVAKIADSLYYKNATVTLEEVISGRKIAFTRADATKEGYPRKLRITSIKPAQRPLPSKMAKPIASSSIGVMERKM
jgi:hypothetical protein